jgi:hypothetical protein
MLESCNGDQMKELEIEPFGQTDCRKKIWLQKIQPLEALI